MANLALPNALQPSIVNARISQLTVYAQTFQEACGCQQGGPNERQSPYGRRGSVDVFNDTREVATAIKPGGVSVTIAPQPVGNYNFTIPSSHEDVPVLLEMLNNLRPIGGPTNVTDSAGMAYIKDQETILKERIVNLREFQLAAMFRGSYTYTITGLGQLAHAFTGGTETVNYQVPAGNLTQLNMIAGGSIIGTSWDNPAAKIVDNLFAINNAFIQNVGAGLTDVFVSSVMWGYICNNTQVINLGGSTRSPFEYITRDEKSQNFTARLWAAPWITFHIVDNGVNLSGTFTKLIADTAAIFTVPLTSKVVQMWQCTEPVVEEWNGRQSNPMGEYYYYEPKGNPARYQLMSVYNALPVLMIPKAVAYGTVKF